MNNRSGGVGGFSIPTLYLLDMDSLVDNKADEELIYKVQAYIAENCAQTSTKQDQIDNTLSGGLQKQATASAAIV